MPNTLQNDPTGELIIAIDYYGSGRTEFMGTRAMLEAEGIIPANTRWPEAYGRECWNVGTLHYELGRQRPEGAKGPRKAFATCDWWCLSQERPDGLSYQQRVLRDKKKELEALAYQCSREGQIKRAAYFERRWAAGRDTGFQAFLAQFPGLLPKQRGRKLSTGERAHG